ncbi:MAG: LuxR C-terminal-related transcriptional regulator [Clostridiales Family XIII bacterium]|jgi:LuxR family maltose regulon positive regulatory protein|nr:LuxR C-terminal-related transcriptional regulator [Clostridiales Family XIII bacterium]
MKKQEIVKFPADADNTLVHLDRPRMDSLLSEAIKSDITTVVAGAGYGKTEAVYSFLRKQNIFTIWLGLSEFDNVPTRFWETFAEALSSDNKPVAKMLSDIGFPDDGSLYNRYVDAMTDAIVVGRRYVTVFDDFHLIHDPTILKFIDMGIRQNIPGMSRIFISREDPIQITSNHLKNHTISHLNEDDLRFTKAEMCEFFELQHINLTPDMTEKMYINTDGWIFAINLAALFFKKNPKRARYAVSSIKSDMANLIENEIFADMPEDQRHFLIKMSLINHLSPDLLSRLPDGDRLMEELNRINAFVRYDAYLDTYRIHNLFVDYLQGKQELLTEDEKSDTYEKAANWCLDNGYTIDAVNYFQKLGNYDRIVDIAFGNSLIIPPGIGAYIADVLSKAPREVFEQNGTLNVVYARLLMSLGRLDAATKFIDATISVAEILPESDYKYRVLFGLHNNLGFIELIDSPNSGRYDFSKHFEKGDEYFRKSNYKIKGAASSINLSPYICRIGKSDSGEPDRFIDALTKMIPFASHSMNGCMYGADDLARCELSFMRAEFENGERFGFQALYKAREREQHEIENRALFILLRLNLATGKYNDVRSILYQIEAQPEMADYANRYIMKDIVTSWFYAQIGHTDQMADWITSEYDETAVNYLLRGLEFFTKTKYYIAEKRYHRLMALLESQDTESGISIFLFGRIAIAVTKAICLYHLNEYSAALKTFKEAYELAAPNSLDMVFIEFGNEMRALACYALKHDSGIPTKRLETIQSKASTYAKRLAYVRTKFNEDEKASGNVDLTSKEIEVLTDLAQGLSRVEIANAHNISINTVKTMLPHIFRKLEANNTIDAIRIAIASGIIE